MARGLVALADAVAIPFFVGLAVHLGKKPERTTTETVFLAFAVVGAVADSAFTLSHLAQSYSNKP